MPAGWHKNNVTAEIPTAIMNTSRFLPENLSVFAWTDNTWMNPHILNDDEINFTAKNDTIFGDYFRALIPSSKYNNSINIGFDAAFQNGYFFSKYQQGNEGIYQLAIFPSDFIDEIDSKKAAILIDYDASNTIVTKSELLNTIKSDMLNNLTSKDSFNLLFSNLSITRYSEKWISASETNIEAAFSSLVNPLSSYSNLTSLLGSGIDFVKSNGNNGKVILISNSGQYGDYQVANTLISDLVGLMNPKIQIHISDYQSLNFNYFYFNGTYYLGNEYFYSNLSKITLGSYHRTLNDQTLSGSNNEAFKYIGGSIKSFDLYTSVNTGFCHSRYNITETNNIAYLNDPILQIGKFKGELPFIFEISGEYNNEIFSREVEIQEQNVINDDSISEEIWAGQFIKELESGQQSNDIINEIIYNSLNERVLSLYTAFLCLEDTFLICKDCKDESQLIDIPDLAFEQDSISIYPNPFSDILTIEILCSNPNEVKELSIYNVTGSVVYQFNTSSLVKGENSIKWNGNSASGDEVKSGIYILVYRTLNDSKTIKIAKN
jgi:Ca-activated chloride channel family protein